MSKVEQYWISFPKFEDEVPTVLDAPSEHHPDAKRVVSATYTASILKRAMDLLHNACAVQMPYCGCRACHHALWFKQELRAFQEGASGDKT